jgi:hypothetical protein
LHNIDSLDYNLKVTIVFLKGFRVKKAKIVRDVVLFTIPRVGKAARKCIPDAKTAVKSFASNIAVKDKMPDLSAMVPLVTAVPIAKEIVSDPEPAPAISPKHGCGKKALVVFAVAGAAVMAVVTIGKLVGSAARSDKTVYEYGDYAEVEHPAETATDAEVEKAIFEAIANKVS